jgi:hypothetical protein
MSLCSRAINVEKKIPLIGAVGTGYILGGGIRAR